MLWLPVAAALAVAAVVAPGVAAGSAPSSASFSAYDYGWSANGNAKSTKLTVAQGSTVTFSYPSGRSEHNADFGSGSQPTSCAQTAGLAVGKVPPLPHIPTGAGWSGTCTFNAPGTYTFHCDLHPFMTGTVVVEGPPGPPLAGSPASSISVAARQRGSTVRVGQLTINQLRTGTVRFAATLDSAAKRALRRQGRLTIATQLVITSTRGTKASAVRRVQLRP